MSPGLADATRPQLSQLQSRITGLGALVSVVFKGVGPGGADIYQVNFDKGSIDYRIWLGPDAKTESAKFPTQRISPRRSWRLRRVSMMRTTYPLKGVPSDHAMGDVETNFARVKGMTVSPARP